MRGPEDGNEDDQQSLTCFLVSKTFNHSVVFIYISFKILVLILIIRSPYIMCSVFLAVSVTNLILITLVSNKYVT